MEEQVVDHINEEFPCPRLSEGWIDEVTASIRQAGHVPEDSWDAFIKALDETVLSTPFTTSAEPGSGLSPTFTLSTMCTVINRPIVLELVHLTDMGDSAFSLERVRINRERSFRLRLLALAGRGEVVTPETLVEIRRGLPPYPRKCLKLYLSDGTQELEAVELEQLDVELGVTPMGTKIEIFGFPMIEGVALLRRANVRVLGGAVEALEHVHQVRLMVELYDRMQEELVLAKEAGVSPSELFSEHGVSNDA